MAFCPNCGEKVDPTKPFCASCGVKIAEYFVTEGSQEEQPVRTSACASLLKNINWRVYALVGLVIVLAVLFFAFKPHHKSDVPFAKWGGMTEQEKVTVVTQYMEENHPDLTAPDAKEIIRYCDLLYEKKTPEKNVTLSSVLSEFVTLDKEQRIAIIAKLSGDLIE